VERGGGALRAHPHRTQGGGHQSPGVTLRAARRHRRGGQADQDLGFGRGEMDQGQLLLSVLRIREILLRIRVRNGSTDPYLCLIDPDADPDPAIFVSDLQDINKIFHCVFCLLLFEGTFTHFSKLKSQKEVTKQ
jgi:hypothetical protein